MARSNSQRGGFHYAYLIVLSCIVMTCLPCALVLSCAGIFFTPVSEFFGVPKASFTLYFSVLNLAMMATLPVAGKRLAARDARVVLSVATALCGLGMFGMASCQEVWQFYLVGIVLGVGVAPLIYLASSLWGRCRSRCLLCGASLPTRAFSPMARARRARLTQTAPQPWAPRASRRQTPCARQRSGRLLPSAG